MSNFDFDLIGVGSPIVDVLARVPESFLQIVGGDKGGMVLTDSSSIAEWIQQLPEPPNEAPGGSAGNTLFAAVRMGIQGTFLGKIGNDAGADYYRNALKSLGGDDARFKIGDIPNARCLSLITPDSERTMRTDLGAAATLAPDEISVDDFAGCRHAHIEGYLLFNRDLMMAVLQSAKAAGCSISLDLASFEVVNATKDVLSGILQEYVDMVFANEEEAAAFTGGSDPEAMTRQLSTLCQTAVVKIGADGAWLSDGSNPVHVPALPDIEAVDTTGAGDYWAAGFLTGWIQGKPLETCASMGARLGAEIVQVIGAELNEATWEKVLADFS
ncbi:MAG: adenosine kinase [Puniceicoccaceae bacterium]